MTRKPIVLMTRGSNHKQSVDRLHQLGATVLVAETIKGARKLYEWATHIYLPGGPDIHPAQYGRKWTHARPGSEARDELELALADAALLQGKPLMGVCRGHQVITVAAGGTLIQDLWRERKVLHRRVEHNVSVECGTLLHSLARLRRLAHPTLWVNSYHHQAVDSLPAGWQVAARAEDGTVEAVEWPGRPIVSVQWHPEAQITRPAINLFKGWLALDAKPLVARKGRKGSAK